MSTTATLKFIDQAGTQLFAFGVTSDGSPGTIDRMITEEFEAGDYRRFEPTRFPVLLMAKLQTSGIDVVLDGIRSDVREDPFAHESDYIYSFRIVGNVVYDLKVTQPHNDEVILSRTLAS